MPVTDVLPPCGDDEPERNAGGPIDDGWPAADELCPCANDPTAACDFKGVCDGLDIGLEPDQPPG